MPALIDLSSVHFSYFPTTTTTTTRTTFDIKISISNRSAIFDPGFAKIMAGSFSFVLHFPF